MISSAQRLKHALLAACLAATAALTAEDVRAEDLALKEAASMTGAVLWLSSGAPGLVLAVVAAARHGQHTNSNSVAQARRSQLSFNAAPGPLQRGARSATRSCAAAVTPANSGKLSRVTPTNTPTPRVGANTI